MTLNQYFEKEKEKRPEWCNLPRGFYCSQFQHDDPNPTPCKGCPYSNRDLTKH